MRKPKYMEEMLKIVLLCLGVTFLFCGLLCFAGALKPSKNSTVQDPTSMGFIFSFLSMTFFIFSIILKVIVSFKNKWDSELLRNGMKVNGTVEKVYLKKYMDYWNQHPYTILYSYSHQGKAYHHRSYLLWDKPHIAEHDSIVVYVNDSGKSTIRL